MRLIILFLTLACLLISPAMAEVTFPRGSAATIVAEGGSEFNRRVIDDLSGYMTAVTGMQASVVDSLADAPDGAAAIMLFSRAGDLPLSPAVPEGSGEAYALVTGELGGRPVVVAAGATPLGLKRAVQRLIVHSRQEKGGLAVPTLNEARRPWIPAREAALCPWMPHFVRGIFANPHADPRQNVFFYSDEQMARYVAMLDWLGFSGIQLMDVCYGWQCLGTPEAYHDRLKTLARAARANGQQVTLWVWAAEFDGFGWRDPSNVYTPTEGRSAYEDPAVRRTFEKYYDLYADMAPYTDRLIGHFFDPGRLERVEDVYHYMRMLEGRFRAVNPAIEMGIDAWGRGNDYLDQLVGLGLRDYLLLAGSMPNFLPAERRVALHEKARELGLRMGVWGWYTAEYETDQKPAMFVNGHVLRSVYREIRDNGDRVHPIEYWSEMDAYHVLNIFTLYQAAQLLWDPEADPDQLLREISHGIWGPGDGARMFDALKLIEEARSGESWDTYWWTMPGYRLGTADPAKDLARATEALGALKEMRGDEGFVPKFPLPLGREAIVEMMLPHLMQIRDFAEFRIGIGELRAAWKSGLATDEVGRRLQELWRPIPEYTTWTGTFGVPEAMRQEHLVLEFAREAGVTVSPPAALRAREAGRLLQKIEFMQRQSTKPLRFTPRMVNEFVWPEERMNDRLAKLVEDGVIEAAGDGSYQLQNWSDYAQPEGGE